MGWSQELPQTYNINIKQEEQNLYDNISNFCHRYYNTGMVITVCGHSLGKALLPHYTIGGGGGGVQRPMNYGPNPHRQVKNFRIDNCKLFNCNNTCKINNFA